ncbi:DUF6702 family protein [Acanthopleuribacter pedis]|uniref:Uncharacterized protein n=1 Tax=Acanthopleuribacter pedis TaxID=442870 RepID=A0A8J7U5D6_9BACT|nr:DUF6702 family protein [Acanthopleuribacter pedis]MBO1320744.1 hypothetical protein [Acanthopleuribacter pedis]
MKRLFVTALLLAGGAFPLWAHRFHASLTQAEWNPKSNSLEVVVRVFANDIERAVSQAAGEKWRLDDQNEAPLWAYVRDRFAFVHNGKEVPFQPIGHESDVRTAWLYLEVPLSGPPTELALRNTLLIEINTDQVNTVNLKMGSETISRVFDLNRHRHGFK